jgi:hypothetical protein
LRSPTPTREGEADLCLWGIRGSRQVVQCGPEGTRDARSIFEGDRINERALKGLVRAAVDFNQMKKKKKAGGYSGESTQKQEGVKL